MLLKPISWLGMERQNLTRQKHAFTNQSKRTTTKNKQKLKPDLIVSYNIRPGNGEGLFWFRCFINLPFSYLLRHLPTYLQPRDPHGAEKQSFKQCLVRQYQTSKPSECESHAALNGSKSSQIRNTLTTSKHHGNSFKAANTMQLL